MDDSTVTEVENEAPTMDDTILATLKDIESREESEDTPRDESGKFAAKEPKEPEPEEAPEVEATETTEEPVPIVVPPELQKLGLRKDEAEAMAQAPEAVRQAFIRRSEEMHKGIEQYRSKAQFGAQIEQAITPFISNIQATGQTPDAAVKSLLTVDNVLRHGSADQKTQMLTRLAQEYGVNLAQAQEYQQNQPYVDPQVNMLQQKLSQVENFIAQQNQAREWQEREQLNSEIAQFSSKPENVHFEAVRGDMAGLLQAGLAPDLQTAYDMAIYANPTVRAQVLAAQQAKANAEKAQIASQKAKEAKAAAAVNVSRRGTLSAAKTVGTMEDTIREEARRLGFA